MNNKFIEIKLILPILMEKQTKNWIIKLLHFLDHTLIIIYIKYFTLV